MERFMPDLVRRTALRGQSQSGRDRLAKGLGYFSIALGVAELVAPRKICNAIGLRGLENVVRAYGVREIAAGVAILTSHNPEPWIWARVAGDLADIATVATGLQQDNDKKDNNLLALSALAAVTALDVVCATALNTEKGSRATAIADYSDRSGFPGGLPAARGAARDFEVPEDMKTPKPLRAFAAE
jgi:malic enzyme